MYKCTFLEYGNLELYSKSLIVDIIHVILTLQLNKGPAKPETSNRYYEEGEGSRLQIILLIILFGLPRGPNRHREPVTPVA